MSALAAEVGAINLGQGFPNWDGADLAKQAAIADGVGQRPVPAQPRDPRACGRSPALWAAAGTVDRPRCRGHGDHGMHRGAGGEHARAGGAGRRGGGDRTVLRRLSGRSGPGRRHPQVRHPAPTRLRSRPRRVGGGVLTPDQGDPGQHATQPDRSGPFRGRDGCHRPAVHRARHIAITDEVYEEMVFERPHLRLAGREGMWERTLTLSSLGKTFSLTGWKVGVRAARSPR